jgi:hypothetical protein
MVWILLENEVCIEEVITYDVSSPPQLSLYLTA